jgi:hypothetical protein
MVQEISSCSARLGASAVFTDALDGPADEFGNVFIGGRFVYSPLLKCPPQRWGYSRSDDVDGVTPFVLAAVDLAGLVREKGCPQIVPDVGLAAVVSVVVIVSPDGPGGSSPIVHHRPVL